MIKARVYQEENRVYLLENIGTLDTYQKVKEIDNFIKRKTKTLELYVDNLIKGILEKNGIIARSTDKSVLNALFSALKDKNKEIVITDLYKNDKYDHCVHVGYNDKSQLNVWLEDNTLLQCGVEVIERWVV